MSIIYEALRKIESQTPLRPSDSAGKDIEPAIAKKNPWVNKDSQMTAAAGLSSKAKPPLFSAAGKNILIALIVFFSITASIWLFYGFNDSSKELASLDQAANTPPLPENKVTAKEPFALEGIVYDDKMPLAIINAKVHKHYDRLGKYMVADITEREVILRHIDDESLIHLTLPF
jgi:hypothetical protein